MAHPSHHDPAFRDHLAWLGYLQPDGLVVSPAALLDAQFIVDRSQTAALQQRLAFFVQEAESQTGERLASIPDVEAFLTGFLEWPQDCIWGTDPTRPIPQDLRVPLRELEQDLAPTYALRHPKAEGEESPWLVLVKVLPPDTALDLRQSENARGWNASEYQRFERLLRETKNAVGLLTNHREFRLVYTPRGESTGHITFPVSAMGEISGRLILGAFHQLLKGYTLLAAPSDARLHTLLRRSREYQANVSTKLAEQVVEALYELLRGFRAANGEANGALLGELLAKKPDAIYRGLLNSLLRLVFLLYAEDRGLMPTSGLYVRHYSVHGLFERLRADAERYPDTMDHRYGAWSQLLAVFRMVFRGSKNPFLSMPPRRGYLFDPEPFPFLEGRNLAEPAVPLVPDGTIYRVLSNLLLLDGERLSYKTLDVEQIGSVYETIMGFRIETAPGRMIALKPKKRHGAPVHIDLDALVALKPAERDKQLLVLADTKLPDGAARAMKAAETVDALLAALEKRIDLRASPSLVPAGGIIFQPTDERRRSGSHYTPRSFTEPIVRKTLEPIFQRLGTNPLPAAILDLKIADIAVGSAAFLVESCRQLADALVASWHHHQCIPAIPPDEDEVLYARRVIAQRCLYGVDRNPMAVDLAKLSLWLATMARDHPFTFLDHAIKCGDSLVGLTNKQIAAFHWDLDAAEQRILGQDELERTVERISEKRKKIIEWADDSEYAVLKKRDFLASADGAADRLRSTANLAVAAFFAGSKPKDRQRLRDEYLERHLTLRRGQNEQELLVWQVDTLKELSTGPHPIRPFHWEIEFPEVFTRTNPGFDGIVGNPPFAGKNTLAAGNTQQYPEWLKSAYIDSHGNADLVAYFYRHAFNLLREQGTFGLIATKTIQEGDTRSTGLRFLCKHGGTIYAARRRVKWPGDASVVVGMVNLIRGTSTTTPFLDGKPVKQISAYLFHSGGHDDPKTLDANSNKSFIGSYILGIGFTFDDSDNTGKANSTSLIADLFTRNPQNRSRIFPYINGQELNDMSSPIPARYIIHLSDLSLEEASAYSDLLEIVRCRVKPDRDKLNGNPDADRRRKFWWQWGRYTPALYQAIEGKERVLGRSLTSKFYESFNFISNQPKNIYDQTFIVFNFQADGSIALLCSQIHGRWAEFFGPSMGETPRYTPTDCFETYPFPAAWDSSAALHRVGREFYEFRAALMIRNNEGLTKTYNRFHDPEERSSEIHELRRLHTAMDRVVLDAYGWQDIPTDCQFLLDYEEEDDEENDNGKRKKKKPWRYRWPDEIRDEVLARLLALNADRYAEEKIAGERAKTSAPSPKPAKAGRKSQKVIQPILGERELPTEMRFSSPSPQLYAIHLVTALLSERPEGLPWKILSNAFAAVTRPSLMSDLALPEEKQRVAEWSQRWNEAAKPSDLIPAVQTLRGANLMVEGEGVDAVFFLMDGARKPATAYIGYDAWLALRIVEPLAASVFPHEDSVAVESFFASLAGNV